MMESFNTFSLNYSYISFEMFAYFHERYSGLSVSDGFSAIIKILHYYINKMAEFRRTRPNRLKLDRELI